jgi:serine/threonine protein kinase
MKQEVWRRVEEVFHAALERAPDARQTFLDGICDADTEVRRQVELLLAKEEQAGSFLEVPALEDATAALTAGGSLLGRQVGPYQIVNPLGAGGMGEVYRAHDSKLGRDVAVKTLPHEFARDPARLSRLRREARTLASLNHPNIAAIYGLEESAEADCLVMELVEGEMLRGPLPVQAALNRGVQVAAALEAAHAKGIIHRDLKPANIKVTPQGTVKVLDFGLAKAIWGPEGNPELLPSAAGTGVGSVAGQVVGTPGYMSPEQARGGEVDRRTDIWAFGCLLYELLTGERAFPGETQQDTIAAVLEREPDWRALPAKTPAAIRELLRHCLQKDAGRRLNHIADAHRAIEKALRGRNRWRIAAVAATVLAMLAMASEVWLRGSAHSLDSANQPAQIQALAVLPLENFSNQPEQEYFADGMTEALISEIGKVSTPRVISRQSVMQYKHSKKALPEIARELKVNAILGGAVERSGDRVRVSIHLDQVAPERQLWAKSYDRSIRDVLVLEDEIALAVADEIQVKLTPPEASRLARARRVNPEAHDAFLRGQFFAHKGTELDEQTGIAYFKEAIEKDPGSAEAYAGLAEALLSLANPLYGGGGYSTKEILPEAKAATAKALELDPSLAEAHIARAMILSLDWNWLEVEKENQLALKLSPSYLWAHVSHEAYLLQVGRFDEAIAEINEQIRLDPLDDHQDDLAFVAYMSRQFDVAIKGFKNAGDDHALGWTYTMKNMYPEAIAAFERFASQSGRQPVVVSGLAMVYGRAGKKQKAQKLMAELKEIARHRPVSPNLFVNAYLGLGDKNMALTWLEKGYEEHDPLMVYLKVGPGMDSIHSEPRFQAVLRRMNFPP